VVDVIVRKLKEVKKDGTEVWEIKKILAEYFRRSDVQVSINSWGHLVVRLIKSEDEEILVVFNVLETREIAQYIKKVIANAP